MPDRRLPRQKDTFRVLNRTVIPKELVHREDLHRIVACG
jgi:hypothetical protein